MKLLLSSFLCYYLASSPNHACWAFAPSCHLHHRRHQGVYQQFQGRQSTAAMTTSLAMVGGDGLTDPVAAVAAMPDNDELLRRKELAFQQVLKEVAMVKEYLAWLISSSSSASDHDDNNERGNATFGDILATKAAAGSKSGDMVELLGGSNDAVLSSSSSTTTTTPSLAPKSPPTEYLPSYRSDLGNTILLSGTTDPTLLSYLNNNFFGQSVLPNFNFDTIRALVQDVAAAKKGAISRDARYGGLLDKLVIEPLTSTSPSSSVLPTQEELGGATSWIVQLSPTDSSLLVSTMKEVAQLALTSSTLKNVIVMVVDENSHASDVVVEGWNAILEASHNNFKATLLSVGELYEAGNEGGFYHIGPISGSTATATSTPATTTATSPFKLSRKKAYQLLAHALALESTAQQAYMAYEYPSSDSAMMEAIASPYAEGEFALRDDSGKELEGVADEYKDVKMTCRMIQAMRELGFTQVMELDVLVGKGIDSYKEYIANPPNKENVFSAIQPARDEEDERIMRMLQEESAKKESMTSEQSEKEKKIAIEGIAKEWAIKEYTLRMLNGVIDDSLSEKDFLVSVWDQALAEGTKTYELINSKEYSREMENRQKSMAGIEDKLFWEGMPPLIRKKREKMVEKVKKQYMDLLSEEELEKIILMGE